MLYQIALRLWLKKGCLPWQPEFPRVGPATLAANSNSQSYDPRIQEPEVHNIDSGPLDRGECFRSQIEVDVNLMRFPEMFVIVCLCLFNIQRIEGALMQPQTPKDAKLQRGTNDDQRSEVWGR